MPQPQCSAATGNAHFWSNGLARDDYRECDRLRLRLHTHEVDAGGQRVRVEQNLMGAGSPLAVLQHRHLAAEEVEYRQPNVHALGKLIRNGRRAVKRIWMIPPQTEPDPR